MKKSLLTILGLSANLFLIGCADEQARAQIADTNAKLAQIQQSIGPSNTANNPQITTLNKLEDLQSQIDQLNGNVDTLSHNQKAYQETQDQLHQSVEQQVQALQQAAGQSVTSPKVASAPMGEIKPLKKSSSATTSANKSNLNSALKKIKNRNFPAAIKELKTIVKTSPDPETAADAQYYLAVSYAANNQYTDAIATARKFVNDNPDNRFAPDALRTEYISQMQLGMKQSAAKSAALLNKNYPDSPANKKVQAAIKPANNNADTE